MSFFLWFRARFVSFYWFILSLCFIVNCNVLLVQQGFVVVNIFLHALYDVAVIFFSCRYLTILFDFSYSSLISRILLSISRIPLSISRILLSISCILLWFLVSSFDSFNSSLISRILLSISWIPLSISFTSFCSLYFLWFVVLPFDFLLNIL